MNCVYRTLLATVAVAFSGVTASAETITVCASGCDYTSINAAIDAASNGDVIQLAAETYFEGEQIDTLGKAIMLRGVLDKAGEPASVLDGAGTHRVLLCQNGESEGIVFKQLVIKNGFAENGGGMYVGGGSRPLLLNCRFVGNHAADEGGGMFNASSPMLVDCVLQGNSAGFVGGGMYNWGSGSSPTLTRCVVVDNSAVSVGGGIANLNINSPTWTALSCCLICDNEPSQIYKAWTDGGGNCVNDSCEECGPPPSACPSDLDQNCRVDASDLGLLIAAWNSDGANVQGSDINCDGIVNAADLGLLIGAWGPCQ